MKIKICGLTRNEDALLADLLGAWALGLVFYPRSPRHVTAEKARGILLGTAAPAIGVFVNQGADAVSIAKAAGLKGIQLHGDETPDECRLVKKSFSGTVIKALRDASLADLYAGAADYILIDAAAGGQYGGTGKMADWDAAAKLALTLPLILAGGLGAENIRVAAERVRPFALDLSSGVEASPGLKDHAKLEALFRQAHGGGNETQRA